jgi:hypothetical protein
MDRMAKRKGWMVGAAALLLLAGCQNIPYYDESLNWFSWSGYDPEVEAIEREIPPPGALEAPAAADNRGAQVRDGRGGYVQSDPPPGGTVSVGATPLASGSAITSGSAVAAAGHVDVAGSSGSSAPAPGSPLVGIRSSVGPSVTWRSPRGTP